MKFTEKPFSIPDHWRWIELKGLAEINPTFDRDDLSDSDPVSFVGMKRVEELSGRIDLSETEPLSEVRKGYTYFEDGDVLFAKITPCMENGKVAVARGLENGVGFGSTEFHVIRHPEEATQEWIFHYLIQEGFRRDAKRAMTGSAGQKRVPTGYIEEVPIPLPPLPEQRRIVAKIEELFSNLDAGMADLQAAGQQLERYRLSVLQAAVEGRLTADWRRTHDPEPADQLLERITKERRRFWESWYRWEKYESKGKEPPSGWKKRFKTYEKPDAAGLPDIPSTWEWVQVQQVGQVQLGRQRSPEYHEGENMVPYLRVANVFEKRIDTSDVKEMHFTERAYQKYRLEEGDILLNEGQSLELVGRPAMYHGTPPDCCFQNTLIRFRGYESLNRQYALLIFQGYMHTGRFADVASQTTSVAHLGSRRFSKMPFPLPPLAEQRKMVQEAERLLSVADDAATTAEREHTRAERLRQSILKQAFSGRLVPHDEGAAPPAIESSATDGSPSSASGDTGSSSDEDDVIAEELYNGGDPGKQIEMDL